MSLELKIKEWEKNLPKTFEKIKDYIEEDYIFFGENKKRCFDPKNQKFKYQKCKECNFIYNILDYKNKSIVIPSGKKQGLNLNILVTKSTDNGYQASKDIKYQNNSSGKKILKFYKKDFFCIDNVTWFKTRDKTLNLSMIMLVLKLFCQRKNFPLFVDFLNFYHCTDKNYLVYIEREYISIGDFNKNPSFNNSLSPLAKSKRVNIFSPTVARDIILQASVCLRFFSNLFFTHNELDYTKLRFSLDPFETTYEETKLSCSFRLYIFPSGYSSISVYDSSKDWWGRFFYSLEKKTVTDIEGIPFDDFVIQTNGSKNYYFPKTYFNFDENFQMEYLQKRIYFYRINGKADLFLKSRKNRGSVAALGSFDVVCLFCSLMTINYFSEAVIENKQLLRIWKGIWTLDEEKIITEILTAQTKPLLFFEIFMIVKKFYIRFDALEYLFRELSELELL